MVAYSLLSRPPIKWATVGEKTLAQEERKRERETRRQKVHRSYEYRDLDSYKEMNSSGMLKLESLERALRYLFENSDLKLGAMQERLVNEIIVAFLKKIFGDELVGNMKYLCKKFMITEMSDTLAVLVPIMHLFDLITIIITQKSLLLSFNFTFFLSFFDLSIFSFLCLFLFLLSIFSVTQVICAIITSIAILMV